MSNQPASLRREKISLGNQHLQLAGKLSAQSGLVKGLEASPANVQQPQSSPVVDADNEGTVTSANTRDTHVTMAALLSNTGGDGSGNYEFIFLNDLIHPESFVRASIVSDSVGGALTLDATAITAQAEGTCTVNMAQATAAGTVPPVIRILVE